MEAVYFIVAAVALYFAADRILNLIETRAGRRFEYRQIYFFAILGGLAIVSFALIRRLLG